MDKQQLASTIWNTVEDLRGNIESYRYKDYILALLFYKFLTDQEYELFSEKFSMEDDEIYEITEDDQRIVDFCKNNLGYFIEPKYLYRKWIENINEFEEDQLVDSLNAYDRHVPDDTKHVFGGIFDTIKRNLTSLAPTVNERTKVLRKLLIALKDIPTVNTEYDVLGYVYEYLISQFSAGAGKKSGEFFTPAEVSTVIARIVAHNLKGKERVQVFDPTAGSGSLLLAVGDTFEKVSHQKGKVKYYYQELERETYNMCRQNLVMRGVNPSNMVGRNGDTLGFDYPYFDDTVDDPRKTYDPVFVDAVVANPPYSLKYSKEEIKNSPRFAEYGMPPESKADLAFLLHGLYHLKSDGSQVIVLPHGVLFRNEELHIRETLIKKHQIETIIGLPSNVFFGTGIPTILICLKKTRNEDDILFIDASKGFAKDGNKNKLREMDIQKIVDTYINREDVDRYARLVPYQEIEENGFNLNISRYINSDEEPESFDTFGVMNGAVPKKELKDKFDLIWDYFPSLYNDLFKEINDNYVVPKTEDIIETINNNAQVEKAKEEYSIIVDKIGKDLENYLFDDLMNVNLSDAQFEIKDSIFENLKEFELIDKYKAYQEFYKHWEETELDIENIHEFGFNVTKELEEVKKNKKVSGKNVLVFDHWEGKILPFEIVQDTFLKDEKSKLKRLKERNEEIKEETDNLISILDEDDGKKVLNDAGTAFAISDLRKELTELFEDIETPEISGVKEYIKLLDSKAKKSEKIDFMEKHSEISWDQIPKNKDGTVGKTNINNYYSKLQASYEFEEDSFGYIVSTAISLRDEETDNNKIIKKLEQDLEDKTCQVVQNLTDEEVYDLLKKKWIDPVSKSLKNILTIRLNNFENELNLTIDKYGKSVESIEQQEKDLNKELKEQLLELTGSKDDLAGIQDFIKMLEV